MSFDIILYRNESPTNFVNKDLKQIYQFQGDLRDGASLLDPVIVFQASDPGFHANMTNYLYIADFGRYYYITDIISTHFPLWEIHCHVDVLMSYAEQIKLQNAIVARQEANYNMMLDDGFFMCYQNPRFQTKLFSNATPFEQQEFVLVVAGSSTANTISDTSSTSLPSTEEADDKQEENEPVQSS